MATVPGRHVRLRINRSRVHGAKRSDMTDDGCSICTIGGGPWRGSHQVRRSAARAEGLPPGQYLTEDFPVLSAGPTPRVDLDTWQFAITTETGAEHTWTWAS